ncbi:caspase domain-containing protein [Streptomyces sp. NPDC058268]|uniref:caspase family protein n=1 Tax=Streptomyces sp. NPDC058268 TaxID=3346413 RepID=UPI0036EFCD3D
MRLPDGEKSRIVLIGASRYNSMELPDVPAIKNNVSALYEAFTGESNGIVTPENCIRLLDPEDQASVGEALTSAAQQAEDLLLIYYAGHGLLTSGRYDLFLSTINTSPGLKLPFTGVDYAHIRDACMESDAKSRVVILDCCYSGRAISGTLSASESNSAFFGQVQVAGTYVLAASPGHSVARVHPGDSFTVFTGEFLRILRDGIAGGEELLTLNSIYKHLQSTFRASGDPIPQQQITENADVMALGKNTSCDHRARDYRKGEILSRRGNEKLSNPLSSGTFIDDDVMEVPRVPRTLGAREELILNKPPKWDYLLYASSLWLGMESLNEKWALYESGRSSQSRHMSVAQLCHYVDNSLDKLQRITQRIDDCLSPQLQDRLFEQPAGQVDPDEIKRMASDLVGVYEDYMDWAMAIRGIVAPHKAARLIEMSALIADTPVREVRGFIQQYIYEIDSLGVRYENSEIASINVNLTLSITLKQEVLDAFLSERKRLN